MALLSPWQAQKSFAQDDFTLEAQFYQDMVNSGRFLPFRNLDMDIAMDAYGREADLLNPDQDVSNTEMDDYYAAEFDEYYEPEG